MQQCLVKMCQNMALGALAVAAAATYSKISTEMLVKQSNSIFCAVYFMIAPLRLAQIV
jgi:hypothetical protein